MSYWPGLKMRSTLSCAAPPGFHALEVKNTAQVRSSDLRGLRAFGDDYPEATRLLIYRGKERFLSDGVICIPAGEFLRALRAGTFHC